MTNYTATAQDQNSKDLGQVKVQIEFYEGNSGEPFSITYKKQTFCNTGKNGTNFASGKTVYEMATEDDARLWITADLTQIYED